MDNTVLDQQEKLKEATHDVEIALNELIRKVSNFFNALYEFVIDTMKRIAEWIAPLLEKYTCNNWRKQHGLPLLRKVGRR